MSIFSIASASVTKSCNADIIFGRNNDLTDSVSVKRNNFFYQCFTCAFVIFAPTAVFMMRVCIFWVKGLIRSYIFFFITVPVAFFRWHVWSSRVILEVSSLTGSVSSFSFIFHSFIFFIYFSVLHCFIFLFNVECTLHICLYIFALSSQSQEYIC